MYCKKVSGVSIPISLSKRNENERAATSQVRRDDPQYLEALSWINARRRGNERRQTAADRLADAKPGQEVKLDHLSLTSLPESLLIRAQSAKSLSLFGNNFTAIPRAILSFDAVQKLDVSCNELPSLPAEIAQMQNLRSLDASHNAIATVPTTIGDLQNLESLNLGDNALTELPSTLGRLSKLKALKLSGNMLNDLPTQLAQCAAVRTLDISRNHFEALPPEIGSLAKLRTLKAGKNRLHDVPPTADDNDGVARRALPESIGNLAHLDELDVAGNPLETLPNSFGPFEYVSRSRFEVTRQGKNTLLSKAFSKNVLIRIANTPLPETLVEDGRLTDRPGAPPPPTPLYEPLYRKETRMDDPDGQPLDEISMQRPIAHVMQAMPEIFAAQTTLGQTAATAFASFMRQAGGDEPVRHTSDQEPVQQATQPVEREQVHPGSFTPTPTVASTQPTQTPFSFPSMQQPRAMGSVFSDSSEESEAPSFRRKRRTSTPQTSTPGETPPAPVYSTPPPTGVIPPDVRDQLVWPAATQPFTNGPAGTPFAPGGRPPSTMPMGAPSTPSGQPFQPMSTPMDASFPLGAFAHAMQNPQSAAFAQALQIASLLTRQPSMPQAHSAPIGDMGVNDWWSDYSEAAFDQMHHHGLDMLGFEEVQQNTLAGLAKHHRERLYLQGEHLTQRVEQAKLRGMLGIPGETVGINVWRLGMMMFRQHVICKLAETVAGINKARKESDPSQGHLVEDPLQIALVYQTIVSQELRILGLQHLRKNMDEKPEFRSMFSHIVSPERIASVRQDILREVRRAEDENGRRTLTNFVKDQPFWKEFLASQQSASVAAWRGAYGF